MSPTFVREEFDLFFEQAWDRFYSMESYKNFAGQTLKKIESNFKLIFEKE